jgi:hypothetical protein
MELYLVSFLMTADCSKSHRCHVSQARGPTPLQRVPGKGRMGPGGLCTNGDSQILWTCLSPRPKARETQGSIPPPAASSAPEMGVSVAGTLMVSAHSVYKTTVHSSRFYQLQWCLWDMHQTPGRQWVLRWLLDFCISLTFFTHVTCEHEAPNRA